MTVPVGADGAVGLYSAVGDAFAGRRLGFGRRRATLAARFARHRGGDDSAIAASWLAGALADTGLIAVVLPPDATPRARLLAYADAPHHAARLVAALPGTPHHAADIVRWHREHDDGTGVPDRLRWDGIPADAAALEIAHAFLEAVEDPNEPRDPAEALFAIVAGIAAAPPRASDIVRWHREHDDGTGVPDRLRWDGIPADAAALGIAHAYLEAVEDPAEPRGPAEALFALLAETGRKFRVELVRAFREFITANPAGWDEPFELAPPTLDEDSALAQLAARIDARDPRSPGRSERLVRRDRETGVVDVNVAVTGVGRRRELGCLGARRVGDLLRVAAAHQDAGYGCRQRGSGGALEQPAACDHVILPK